MHIWKNTKRRKIFIRNGLHEACHGYAKGDEGGESDNRG